MEHNMSGSTNVAGPGFVPSYKIHGGFTEFAHLRLRDHRPGIGDYELPPEFGPKSASLKKSILGKNYRIEMDPATRAGPGEYPIPSTIGAGRSTRFGPELKADEDGKTVFPGSGAAAGAQDTAPRSAPLPPREQPKQYSMALTPDTPSYSIYGRLGSEFDNPYTCSAGPGEYVLPSSFDPVTRGVRPGAHFGLRTKTAETREQEKIPGPGAYDVKRFGDVLPAPRDPLVGLSRKPRIDPSPGPGAYDDPTTIAARVGKRRLKLTPVSTFGGRHDTKKHHTAGPGPAYDTTGVHRLLERNQRHAPKIMPPTEVLRRGAPPGGGGSSGGDGARPRNAAVPIETHLPSDFDYHYLKGKSMLGRWKDTEGPPEATAGPGSYDVVDPTRRDLSGRFAVGPFDPYAAARARDAAKEEPAPAGDGGSIPRRYYPNFDSVEPHRAAATFATAQPRLPPGNNVPGPGHYSPDYYAQAPKVPGHIFYKGDFHDRSTAPKTESAGPGAHYTDDSRYSRSINGDRVNNKGFTMGIRYPARATHQVAGKYRPDSNINVMYDDERTWEVKFKPSPPTSKTNTV